MSNDSKKYRSSETLTVPADNTPWTGSGVSIQFELDCMKRVRDLEAKLAKAVDALGVAIYLLDPDEEDIAKETGLYRIVTTYAKLTGGKDE